MIWERKETAEGRKTAQESQPEPFSPMLRHRFKNPENPRTEAKNRESAGDRGGGVRGGSGMFAGIWTAEGPQKLAKRTANGPQLRRRAREA